MTSKLLLLRRVNLRMADNERFNKRSKIHFRWIVRKSNDVVGQNCQEKMVLDYEENDYDEGVEEPEQPIRPITIRH